MIVYHFRVTLDHETDVVRDIAIRSDQNFLEFHQIIFKSFDFNGQQMSSFFTSNEEWDKGEEIVLFDMDQDPLEDRLRTMEDTQLSEMINKRNQKLLYVYDFLKMWVFYLELIDETIPSKDERYPLLTRSIGIAPDEEDKSLEFEMPVDIIDDENEETDPELKELLNPMDQDDESFVDPDDLPSF